MAKEKNIWAIDIDDVCLDYGGGGSPNSTKELVGRT